MSLTLNMETDGFEGAQAFMAEFAKFGAQIAGVKLNDIQRTPYEFAPNAKVPTNSFILQKGFPDQERDFISLDGDQETRVGQAFEREAQRQLDRVAAVVKGMDSRSIQKKMDQAAGKSYIAAMKEYMAIVRENIDSGRIANNTLSEQYSAIKEQYFGRTYPIGIASEQLIENLSVDGVGLRNIRLIKRGSLLG